MAGADKGRQTSDGCDAERSGLHGGVHHHQRGTQWHPDRDVLAKDRQGKPKPYTCCQQLNRGTLARFIRPLAHKRFALEGAMGFGGGGEGLFWNWESFMRSKKTDIVV